MGGACWTHMTLHFTQSGRPALVILTPLLYFPFNSTLQSDAWWRSPLSVLSTFHSPPHPSPTPTPPSPPTPPTPPHPPTFPRVVNGVPCSGLFQSSPVLTARCNCHYQIWSSFTACHTRRPINLKTDFVNCWSPRCLHCVLSYNTRSLEVFLGPNF